MDMEAQINVSHWLRALLLDLVNKKMNTNTCNKPSTSFYRKYVVRQMIFGTHCITLKITHDMSDLTWFLTCEVNIMPFFFCVFGGGSESIWTVILVWWITLWCYSYGKNSNKLRRLWYFWEMNEQSTNVFEKFETRYQN